MKKLQTAFLLALLVLASCKTASVPAGTSRHREAPDVKDFSPSYAYFAQPTQSRDTLFLLENDNMSRITYNAWSSDTITRRPVIIFVPESDMLCIKKRCNGSLK